MRRQRYDDRAVSDLVGYVLTVGVLLMSVGIVSTVGVDVLDEAQGNQNAQSVERGMLLLETNFEEVIESRAERRATTLSLSTGRLSVAAGNAPSNVTINVTGVAQGPSNYPLGTIRYRFDEATVAFEGGGLFKNQTRGTAFVRTEPNFVCEDDDGDGDVDRAFLTVVTLDGPAVGSSSGGGTVDVVARATEREVTFPVNRVGPNSIDESTGVTVRINSTFQMAWEEYLTGDQRWTKVGTNEYRCESPSGSPMSVYVRQVVVEVSVRR